MDLPVNTLSRAASAGGSWNLSMRLVRTIRARYRHHVAIRQMRHLDDHLLGDIGLGRSEIEYAARFGRR